MVDVHPFKIKEVHVVNSHSLLDKLKMIMKPLLGAKAMKVIHFHSPNSTTLFDFVARELLVNEFGGTWGPIETLKWYWINRTDDHR
jgi:CRAL/TRIO domain